MTRPEGAAPSSAPAPRRWAPWHTALAVVAAATVLRLVVGARTPLVPDEAYYWDWSRRLARGYFDHPPAIAVLIRLGTALFGDTPFGVRVLPILAGRATILLVMSMARSAAGDRAALWVALFDALMPLSAVGSMLATPDAPLLLATATALFAVWRAVSRSPERRPGPLPWWLLAGLAVGAGLLSKYTAVLVAVGVLVALLARPGLRRELRGPGPYAGAALALGMFAPVVLWNAAHGWISFRFQLAHGLGPSPTSWLANEGALLGGQLGLLSPILFPLFVLAVARTLRDRRSADGLLLLGAVAATVFLAFVASALRGPVEANWPAPAYVPAMVVLASRPTTSGGRRWLVAGSALAGVISLVLLVHLLRPFAFVPARRDPAAQLAGWDTLASRVDAARATLPLRTQTRVAGARYQDAAELAFHLPDHPSVLAVDPSGHRNQYDLWPTYPGLARVGDDLVLVAGTGPQPDDDPIVRALAPHFAGTALGETVWIMRGGAARGVWVLRGWRGSWPSSLPR